MDLFAENDNPKSKIEISLETITDKFFSHSKMFRVKTFGSGRFIFSPFISVKKSCPLFAFDVL